MNSWPTKSLGELCDVRIGRTPRRDQPRFWGGNTVWVTVGELDGGTIKSSKEQVSDAAVRECMPEPVPTGTLLFSFKLSIGKMAVAGCPLYTNEAIAALPIRNPKELSRDFLRYALLSESREGDADTAVLGKLLNKEKVRQICIPVPPLVEQERIVKLLDEADELRKLRTQADRRTAALIPALFHEMFGDPVDNPMNWPLHKLPEVCEGKEGIKAGPFGSSLKKDCYTSEGPRIYGQEQVIADDFTVGDYHISEDKFAEMSAYKVASGDVLISLVGTIGKVAIVPNGIESGIINPRLLRVRPRREVLHPVYLTNVLTSPSVTRLFGSVATGMTMGVLNAGLLKSLSVPVPPLLLQKEFAERVAEIRTLETAQATSRSRLDALFQSMLHRAFNETL